MGLVSHIKIYTNTGNKNNKIDFLIISYIKLYMKWV